VPATEVEAIRDRLARRFPGTPVATTEHRPAALIGGDEEECPSGALKGRPVYGFCGIGNPAAFRRTLEDLGAAVRAFRTFPDHHPYSRDDVGELGRWAADAPADGLLVTTQKDWVKLRVAELGGRPLRAVRIGLQFRDGRDEFEAGLRRIAPAVPGTHPDDEEHGCDPST
jgi:tetraacyldisaccharide 4'-kinase